MKNACIKRTKEECLEAVKQYGHDLKYVPDEVFTEQNIQYIIDDLKKEINRDDFRFFLDLR